MSTDSSSSKTILLASTDATLTEWLMNDIGVDLSATPPSVTFSDQDLLFRVSGREEDHPAEGEVDIVVGLIRFVDVLTLQNMDKLLRSVPGIDKRPTAVLIYRNEAEQDFKMSCPYCGQKLWVRDADVDKRGRCPHCKKGFTLPEQESHVRAMLRLAHQVPVMRITRQDTGSVSGPFRKILNLKAGSVLDQLTAGTGTNAKNQTVNVDIDENEDVD